MQHLVCPIQMNHVFVQRGNKGNANYSPLSSTSKHFLNPTLQGIYFVKEHLIMIGYTEKTFISFQQGN